MGVGRSFRAGRPAAARPRGAAAAAAAAAAVCVWCIGPDSAHGPASWPCPSGVATDAWRSSKRRHGESVHSANRVNKRERLCPPHRAAGCGGPQARGRGHGRCGRARARRRPAYSGATAPPFSMLAVSVGLSIASTAACSSAALTAVRFGPMCSATSLSSRDWIAVGGLVK